MRGTSKLAVAGTKRTYVMQFRMFCAVTAVFVSVFAPNTAQSQDDRAQAGIVMQVDALKTGAGLVYCDLYNTEKGFPNKPERAIARVKVKPTGKKADCVFRDVKEGRYAVALWHDVDDDGKLDTNFLGIPREPVGSSNNAKGRFGPPKFRDAAFDYKPPLLKQTVRLE
ncbi:MAG: hypothetical protein B7Y49_00445 [Sphingomonas sp. 28-62-11]|nr:MAG: hypothetical protein B7Y49_00445 [Sphingomonas sp. 28-62-11]